VYTEQMWKIAPGPQTMLDHAANVYPYMSNGASVIKGCVDRRMRLDI